MAIGSSGAIRLGADIGVELGRSAGNAVGLQNASTGGIATINTHNDSADRPDGSAPHLMSEFYSYDHSATGSSIPANARPYIWAEDFHRPTSWYNVSSQNTDTAGDTYDTTAWTDTGNITFGTEGTADADGNYSVERVAYECDLSSGSILQTTMSNQLKGSYFSANSSNALRYGPNEGFPAQVGFTNSFKVEWQGIDFVRNTRAAYVMFELGQDTSDTTGDQYANCDHLVIGYAYRGNRYYGGIGKYVNSTSTLTWLTIDGGSSTSFNHGNDECELYWKPSRASAPYLEVYLDSDIGSGTPTHTYSDSFLASSNHDDIYGARVRTNGAKHRYSGNNLRYITAAMVS
tara:strand:- start:28446 stop:29483 length:1038 start_codon:yes stop_codon:yes gene_type:complete